MTAKQCPKCRLLNPGSAIRCDCGYDFKTGDVAASLLPTGPRRPQNHWLVPINGVFIGLAALAIFGAIQGPGRFGFDAAFNHLWPTFAPIATIWALMTRSSIARWIAIVLDGLAVIGMLLMATVDVSEVFKVVFGLVLALLFGANLIAVWRHPRFGT